RNVSIKSLIQAQHMAKIGNWELNLKNNRLDWSDEIYNIFEIDKGEFGATYEAFLDTIHPEDRAIVDTAYSQSIKNHKPFSIGHRLLMKDGRIKFVREECKTYYESNGKALRSVGTVQDITDQINAKEFMRVSEERYRTLFNSGNDAIFVHDIDEKGNPGNVVDVNDVACKIYGYSKSEFLNISPVKFDEPESFVKTAIPGIKLLFREGKSTFETTHFTKQGKKIYVEINASIFELNGKKMIYSIVRNITGRKESEKILLESNNLNEAIIDSIPGTFYMLDETGRYVRWNKYQRDEIVGKGDGIKDTNAIDTIHPDDRELIGAKIGSVLKDGKTEIVEGRVLLRGGPKFKWFVMTGSKIISGNHAFLVGTGIDITEHKETENKLKEIDKLKDDFLSVTTHELKTPLMPIKSQTQLLLSGDYGEISEKQKMAVEMILRNEELLNTLTNELLDITKIKSNKLKLTLENIDINLLLADIVKDQGDLAKKKSITCSILPTNKIGMIMADKFRLTQVITNLLNNAIKFTPEHGSIEIAVKLLNNELVITIKDTGIGISPENLGKLFVPFFQIEGSVERRYRGTGLGLAICKGIVEAHGGMIWVKSDGLGKGSTFGFSLPINNHVKGAN
ncbi:MAG: PAS domain-containing sensor histidine kinase, partial [bacterium]